MKDTRKFKLKNGNRKKLCNFQENQGLGQILWEIVNLDRYRKILWSWTDINIDFHRSGEFMILDIYQNDLPQITKEIMILDKYQNRLPQISGEFMILDRYQDRLPQISGKFMILDRYQDDLLQISEEFMILDKYLEKSWSWSDLKRKHDIGQVLWEIRSWILRKFMILVIRRMINIKKNPDPDKGLRRAQDSI